MGFGAEWFELAGLPGEDFFRWVAAVDDVEWCPRGVDDFVAVFHQLIWLVETDFVSHDDDVFGNLHWRIWLASEPFPNEHLLAVFLDDLVHVDDELSVELMLIWEMILGEGGFEFLVLIGEHEVSLVAADVKIRAAFKYGTHFAHDGGERLHDLWLGKVDGGVVFVGLRSFDHEEVAHCPVEGGGVAGHIELGNDRHGSLIGESDELLEFFKRVSLSAVLILSGELGKRLGWKHHRLVIGEMQVEVTDFVESAEFNHLPEIGE